MNILNHIAGELEVEMLGASKVRQGTHRSIAIKGISIVLALPFLLGSCHSVHPHLTQSHPSHAGYQSYKEYALRHTVARGTPTQDPYLTARGVPEGVSYGHWKQKQVEEDWQRRRQEGRLAEQRDRELVRQSRIEEDKRLARLEEEKKNEKFSWEKVNDLTILDNPHLWDDMTPVEKAVSGGAVMGITGGLMLGDLLTKPLFTK